MNTLTLASGKPADLRLYLVTDYHLMVRSGKSEFEVVRAAVEGGVTAVQFRDKFRETSELYRVGRQLRDYCGSMGVAFIVNDRLDLALALQADGLHLGQTDLPLEVAREIVGRKMFIGLSVSTVEDTHKALATGADYLGASPIFTSGTKPEAGSGMELSGLSEIVRAAGPTPVIGIGAITIRNVVSVLEAGASGVAIISAIIGAPDITSMACQLRKEIERIQL